MNVLLKTLGILIISTLLSNCSNANAARTQSVCPKNTPERPVSFMLVVLDKEEEGLPIDIVIPPSNGEVIDFEQSKEVFTSILHKEHDVHQKDLACWQAVVKTTQNASGYKPTKQKIAVLWRPAQKIKFSRAVIETIPLQSPVDVGYKYTIATQASDPKNGKTYLDPRIVVRIRH